jgi:acyl carrier protein
MAELKLLPLESDDALRQSLKRCPPETYAAAARFRATGNFSELPIIIRGVIARFLENDRRALLQNPTPSLRLVEDLGVDSLTMMEIVMLAEEALPISISNEELRHLRTLGDVEQFIASKLRGEPTPHGSANGDCFLHSTHSRPLATDRSSATPSDRPAA